MLQERNYSDQFKQVSFPLFSKCLTLKLRNQHLVPQLQLHIVQHQPSSSDDTPGLVPESDPHSPLCCPLCPALESGPCWSPDCGAGSSSWSVTWSCSCWAASRPLLTMRIGKKNCIRWKYSLELQVLREIREDKV